LLHGDSERQMDRPYFRWTTDPTTSGIVATVMVDPDSQLVSGAAEVIIERLAEQPDVDVFFADATVGRSPQLRGAWSPERIAAHPDELDVLVARGVHPSGQVADRLQILYATSDDRIGHLAEPLVRRQSRMVVSQEDHHLAQRLLADRRRSSPPDCVSVIIPTAGTTIGGRRLVEGALHAVLNGNLEAAEVLLVVGDEYQGNPEELCTDPRIQLVRRPSGPWSFSESINLGLLAATHEAVLIVNDDVEMLNRGWLAQMVTHLADPTVAVVGALLLYPDHTVQHAGMVIDDAYPLHCFAGRSVADLGALGGYRCRDMVAVTGACMLVRRSVVLEFGGLCLELPRSFNDVDLCLKLRRHGHRVLFDPDVQLIHLESASREDAIAPEEWNTFVGRWGQIDDPWYHPGFHRPDLPDRRQLNADHLAPVRVWDPGPLRRTVLTSRFPNPRLIPPAREDTAAESPGSGPAIASN